MIGMLYDKIRDLVAILKSEDVDEIEVRHWWTTVRVVRRRTVDRSAAADAAKLGTGRESSITAPAPERPVDAAVSQTGTDESAAVRREIPAADAGGGDESEFDAIVSPMVGTFYRASAPDSEPFVDVGDRVEVGEILCIIEAMKLMNEIEADRSGVIKKVLVHDNQPVEFGQPLFLVESA